MSTLSPRIDQSSSFRTATQSEDQNSSFIKRGHREHREFLTTEPVRSVREIKGLRGKFTTFINFLF